MSHAVKCPTCQGQKIVSRPPDVAGDQQTWVDYQTGGYPCPTCSAKGYLLVVPDDSP